MCKLLVLDWFMYLMCFSICARLVYVFNVLGIGTRLVYVFNVLSMCARLVYLFKMC